MHRLHTAARKTASCGVISYESILTSPTDRYSARLDFDDTAYIRVHMCSFDVAVIGGSVSCETLKWLITDKPAVRFSVPRSRPVRFTAWVHGLHVIGLSIFLVEKLPRN